MTILMRTLNVDKNRNYKMEDFDSTGGMFVYEDLSGFCEWCGKTECKYMHKIRDKYNDNGIFEIGSECIKKVADKSSELYQKAKYDRKTYDFNQKREKKIREYTLILENNDWFINEKFRLKYDKFGKINRFIVEYANAEYSISLYRYRNERLDKIAYIIWLLVNGAKCNKNDFREMYHVQKKLPNGIEIEEWVEVWNGKIYE